MSTNNNEILISVGIPVYNGGPLFELALQSVINQTHKNLEIIISNNASNDMTEEICLAAMETDSRIQYFKQEYLISAAENFRFVLEKATAKYFMWAACDDLRSENYIEVLLDGFKKYPNASILLTDVFQFDDDALLLNTKNKLTGVNPGQLASIQSEVWDSRNQNKAPWRRKIPNCIAIYGLINASMLKTYPWYSNKETIASEDFFILKWLICKGHFVYVRGSKYIRYVGNKIYFKDLHRMQKEAQLLVQEKKFPRNIFVKIALHVAELSVEAIQPKSQLLKKYIFLQSFFTRYFQSVTYYWIYLQMIPSIPRGIKQAIKNLTYGFRGQSKHV